MVKWLRFKKKKFIRSLFHCKKRKEKNKLQLLFSFLSDLSLHDIRCKLALTYSKFIVTLSVFISQTDFSTFLPVYLMNSVLSS